MCLLRFMCLAEASMAAMCSQKLTRAEHSKNLVITRILYSKST